jgi:hypothetical protein
MPPILFVGGQTDIQTHIWFRFRDKLSLLRSLVYTGITTRSGDGCKILLELSRMATYVKYPYLEFHKYRELVWQLFLRHF